MSTCPSPETLEVLASDSIGDATFAGLEQHVSGCDHCRALLEDRASQTYSSTADGLGSTQIDRSLHDQGRIPHPNHFPRIEGFEIEEFLGQGGMGVVYRAWQIRLERHVAIKIVPSGPGTSQRDRERWVREARAGGKVRHPNVVQLHDAGESSGWLYLVMELSEGGSLKDRLDGPVAPRVAASLLETIATAVEQIHKNGLLHLDLKPGNILIDAPRELPLELARDHVKVTDFGIARLDDELEESTGGTSLARPWGTPWYMSPEQAAGNKAAFSRATDIFALGAIFYELLTGYQPFRSESLMGAFDKIRSQEPVAPRMLDRSIPRDLETICLKCLQKEPSLRYRSAQALVDDLRLFLDGKSISARPVSPIEKAWRGCKRRPAVAALAGTLLMTVAGSLLGLSVMLQRSEALRANAEKMRLNSEANYDVASQSLDELLGLFAEVELSNRDNVYFGKQRIKALETAREQEIELSRRYPPNIRGLKRLAVIDEYLSGIRNHLAKRSEAIALKEESIKYWEECLALDPHNREILNRLVLGTIKVIPFLIGLDEAYEKWNRRANALVKQSPLSEEDRAQALVELARYHRERADHLIRMGQLDRAQRELEEDLSLVESDSSGRNHSPLISLSEMLTLAALGRWSGELRVPSSPIHSQSSINEKHLVMKDLAELTCRRVGWLPLIESSNSLISSTPDLESWADRVIALMQSDVKMLNFDPARVPAIAYQTRDYCWVLLRQLRQAGKLEETKRIIDQLLALGNRLVQAYPDQASAYMVLSDANIQRAKEAYRNKGEPVIEWERKARDAAIHASSLDPQNEFIRQEAQYRRERVMNLEAK